MLSSISHHQYTKDHSNNVTIVGFIQLQMHTIMGIHWQLIPQIISTMIFFLFDLVPPSYRRNLSIIFYLYVCENKHSLCMYLTISYCRSLRLVIVALHLSALISTDKNRASKITIYLGKYSINNYILIKQFYKCSYFNRKG